MSGPVRRGGITGWLRAHPGPAALGIVGGLAAIVVGSWLGTVITATRDISSPSTEPAPSVLVAATVEPTALPAFEVASPSATPSATESSAPRSTAETTEAPAEHTPAPEPTPTPAAAAATPRPTATAAPNPRTTELIAFNADGEIWTVAPDGGGLTNLTQTPDVEESNATWSADGTLLAFESRADGGGVDVMRPDGTERRRVADGIPRNSGYFTDAVQWSPKGHELAIAFVSKVVSIIDVDAGDRRDIGTGDRYVDWSPSGRFLAWEDRGRIVAYDTQLESTHTVIGMDSAVSWINWFPSEDRLLFAGFDETGSREMFTVNLDGSGLATVLPDPDASEDGLQLAPDGRHVLFTRSYARTDARDDDVAIFELGAAEASMVLPVTGQGLARWAPDGVRAVAERDGRIFVLGLDGSEPSEIAAGYAPDWRPGS